MDISSIGCNYDVPKTHSIDALLNLMLQQLISFFKSRVYSSILLQLQMFSLQRENLSLGRDDPFSC